MRKKYSLVGVIADFDYHGFWGDWCSPKSLKAWLATLNKGEEAEIEVNSPGGSVIYGIEMANAIKNSEAVIVAHVTGLAASMASVIVCACDRIEMEEASFMMMHDPWSYVEGNADEMRKQAGLLDQMKEVIMSFYRGKFKNRTVDEISALMSDETWYTGNECLENGLDCTVVKSDVKAAASIVGHKFAKIPDAAAKFLTVKEITEEGRAEIDAARAECLKTATDAEPAAVAAEPAATATATTEPVAAVDPGDGGWEARYKGASKKINALTAELSDVKASNEKAVAELNEKIAGYDAVIAERDGVIKDFEDQVKAAGFENLTALIGAVSGLKSDLDKSAHDLAECRERLAHLEQTRDLLTGSVLTPGKASAKFANFAEAVDALGYAKACRQYPELKAKYRAKKN